VLYDGAFRQRAIELLAELTDIRRRIRRLGRADTATLRDHAQAQEVTQEVYLQVWRQATRFDAAKGSTSAWINVIAHRKAIDRVRHAERSHLRDHQQQTQAVTDIAESDPAKIVMAAIDARRNAHHVHAALAAIPAPQRTALVMAYFDGYTQQEISELLTVPLGTVKTRTRDGLRRLHLLLARTYSST
jgi:RNA polymerase sigma-70 factor, ECF subfamily